MVTLHPPRAVVLPRANLAARRRVKWNHIVIWHAVFWLFSRNVPYLLNFSVPLNIPINIVLLKTTFPLGKAPWGKLPRGTFFWFPRGTLPNQLTRGERSPGDFFDGSSPGELVISSPGERYFFQVNVVFSGDFPLGERAFPRGMFVPLGERSPRAELIISRASRKPLFPSLLQLLWLYWL